MQQSGRAKGDQDQLQEHLDTECSQHSASSGCFPMPSQMEQLKIAVGHAGNRRSTTKKLWAPQ
jgi:hypothetical protein